VKIIRSFSGAHGTGKTTAAYQCAQQEKLYNPGKSVHVLADLEVFSPTPINQTGSEQTQEWIFANQIKAEMECMHRFDITVTDRTIVDVIAYTRALGFHGLADGMLKYAEHHCQYYSSIHFKQIQYNQHCHHDGIRDIDLGFRQEVETTMLEIYSLLERHGMIPVGIYRV
jgi:predicted ATPase